jgi:PAT family beta-lactamase induction signal transducer AmpG
VNAVTFSTHRRFRFAGLALLYAAQGAPEGLLYVAVPAWLASRGVEAEAIGVYISIILLPWSLKLINGFLMDRITFLPMGRRRPWLIAAQSLMVVSLVSFGLQAPVGHDLSYVIAVGFLVNLAAAFQDVAIDGMAIDVVPEKERPAANGFMWGGKTLGIAGSSLANGYIIANLGYGAGAIATAAFVGAVMVVPLLARERPGERMLPWTAGRASAEAESRQLHGSWPIVTRLFSALAKPSSLVFGAGVFVALIGYGLHTAFEPVAAVQKLKFSQEEFGNIAALANLIGGIFGILLSGWIASKVGNGNALVAALVGTALVQAGVALVPGAMDMPSVFVAYTVSHALLFVLTSVCIYAAAMNISVPAVAATQFSVYMAVLNLGTSFGAQRFGSISSGFGYEGVLLAAAGVSLAATVLFVGARAISMRELARSAES